MPDVLQVITYVIPADTFVTVLRAIYLKGVGIGAIAGAGSDAAIFALFILPMHPGNYGRLSYERQSLRFRYEPSASAVQQTASNEYSAGTRPHLRASKGTIAESLNWIRTCSQGIHSNKAHTVRIYVFCSLPLCFSSWYLVGEPLGRA